MSEFKIIHSQKNNDVNTLSGEREQKNSSVFLIYRDNDLFKEYVPQIISTLRSTDHVVEIQAFSANTSTQEIKKWAEQNKTKLINKQIISDNTSTSEIEQFIKIKQQAKLNLDKFLSDVIKQTVFGKDIFQTIEESNDSVEIHQEAIFKTLSFIFEEHPEIKPSKVYLVKQYLHDHFPFREEPIFQLKPLEKKPEIYLTETLNKLNIPEIEIVDRIRDVPEFLFDLKNPQKYAVMADRHALREISDRLYSYVDELETAKLGALGKLFILPFESLYSLLTQTGLMTNVEDKEQILLNLKEKLQDRFDKK